MRISPWRISLSRRGFTLVELLVIVAIIAILLALLFPAVMRLRILAAELEDREHLRHMGHAWLAYARAHQGRTVKHKNSDPHDAWIKKLLPYGDVQNSLVSPADERKQERYNYMKQFPTRFASSFVLNPYFCTVINGPGGRQLSCDRVSDCVGLSRAIVILPVSTTAGVPGPGYIFPQGWLANPVTLAWTRATERPLGIQPDRFPNSGDIVPGRSNYFFADGHVEAVTADRIRTWLDAGHQFLIPEK
ncbi:MAG TPA: prepilin-type N-terminal cleavage/methylation domain-containing protein [Gemmatales bacterium]|nr:prepilin-type N-terminal cleavage/methylation domain-containing protein [Gemmatales bacterium]HMP15849.1 prepilin-type N-terminal cleavage/methylation domain-containing protein [Gemmatales bacterium]